MGRQSHHRFIVAIVIGLTVAATGDTVASEPEISTHIVEVALLRDPGLEDDAWFGRAAIYGDTVVVGAHGDDLENLDLEDSGSAHVYVRDGDTWRYHQMLTAPDAEGGETFGHISAIREDIIVVGAPGIWWHVDAPGAAYIFVLDDDEWVFHQKLTAGESYSGAHFGENFDISGDTMVFGGRFYGDTNREGRAFVFTKSGDTWSLQQVLSSDNPAEGEQFGVSAAIDGDTIVVGADGTNHSGFEHAGSAYVFVRNGDSWSLQQKLVPNDPGEGGSFGSPVDISGDTILVSASWGHNSGFDGAGAAYMFTKSGDHWIQQQKLTSMYPAEFDSFGWDLALFGDHAIIGTCGPYREPEPITASLHVYARVDGSWNLQRVITGAQMGVPWIAWESDLRDGMIAMDGWDPDANTGGIRLYEVLPGPEKLVIPSVARVRGAGAFFTSRWDLFNAGSEDMTIEMTYTPRQDVGGSPLGATYELPAGQLLEIVDPLASIFGITEDAVGSVTMSVSEGWVFDLLTQSVVFAQQPDGSEFGQFFPAALLSDGLPAGTVAHLCTTEDPTHNRVNFGVMATEDGTEVEVTPVKPAGVELAPSRRFDLDTGESQQLNNIHGAFDLGVTADVLLEVEVLSGGALVYTSVLDGKGDYAGTSDPTTILPVTAGATQVVLLEVGPVQGIDEFSGSATLVNLSSDATRVTADFFKRGNAGVQATATIDLEAGESVGYSDIVGGVFELQDLFGTVVFTTESGGRIAAAGREFAIFRDAGDDVTGTAGQLMAGLTQTDIFWPGIPYHFIGLSSFETEAGIERSHVAVFNPGEDPLVATFATYGADGDFEGSIEKTIAGGKLMHYNHILDLIDADQDGGVKRLEVTLDGFGWVRAFRVNATGDPITIEPFTR